MEPAVTEASRRELTRLLHQWCEGDQSALETLTPLLYDELRRLASSYLSKERPGHTLQATALVHEAYVQIAAITGLRIENRSHFFGIAARLMRQILVQHARSKGAQKRGGQFRKLSLDEALVVSEDGYTEMIALDDALRELAEFDERKSRIIELRYFGGLSVEEIAETLSISTATVIRDVRMAHAWLYRYMNPDGKSE